MFVARPIVLDCEIAEVELASTPSWSVHSLRVFRALGWAFRP